MPNTATMSFPGIQGVISGSLSIGHGLQPAVASIEVPVGTEIPNEVGTLTLTAPGFTMSLPDCRVDRVTMTPDNTLRVSILDRRWKWQFGAAYALLNERKKDGTLYDDSEKTPREIARFLLDEMGESGYTVDDLPDNTRPEMRLSGTPPAAELDSLCSSLGCSLVLWNNQVRVVQLGSGQTLPSNPLDSSETAIDVPVIPDSIAVVTAPRNVQLMIELEAVAEESDRTLVLIDDASYKPRGGWGKDDPEYFYTVEGDPNKQLALRSVFRFYRIKQEVSSYDGIIDGQLLGLDQNVTKRKRILPLQEELNELQLDADGTLVPSRAYIVGRFFSLESNYQNFFYPLRESFQLDADRGVVIFSRPMYQLEASGRSLDYKPAKLYLTCVVTIRDHETRQWLRFRKDYQTGLGRSNTEPRFELRYDLVPTTTVKYELPVPDDWSGVPVLDEVETNDREIENEMDKHARAVIAGYSLAAGGTARWVGWFNNFSLDGAIRQVTYDFGPGGWFTTVALNTEAADFPLATLVEQRQLSISKQRSKDRAKFEELERKAKL